MAAPLTIEAVLLSALRYGDSSKIVRLVTPELGVVSAIAKGALRPRSRFAGALQPFSLGQAVVIPPRSGELYLLTGFDLLHLPAGIAAAIERYGAAGALAELVQRLAPAAEHPEVFALVRTGLLEIEAAPPAEAAAAGLHWIWALLRELGHGPGLEACVLDGRAVAGREGPLALSLAEGGVLCESCAASHAVVRLPVGAWQDLRALLEDGEPLPVLERADAAAHVRLVIRFVRRQLVGDAPLPASEFWLERLRGPEGTGIGS